MTDLAIDALSTTISPQAVRAAGYVAVLNYLRNVTAQTVAGYHTAGLGFGSIFETAAAESLGGAPAGTADGRTAAAQMRALGQPAGTVHAVNLTDFAPTPTQLPAVVAYWQAYLAETAAWHVVPYGTGWLLEAMGVAGWQNAMDDNGRPGSVVAARAVLYQRVVPTRQIPGASYDEDVILVPLPWWTAAAATTAASTTPTPAAPAAPQPQEDDMGFVIIRNPITGEEAGFDGTRKFHFNSGHTVANLVAAGVKLVDVDPGDYARIPNAA